MDPELKSRLIGLFLALLGLGFIAWNWYTRSTDGSYYYMSAFMGPLLVFMGGWSTIAAPEVPVRKLPLLGWAAVALGCLAGILNLILLSR